MDGADSESRGGRERVTRLSTVWAREVQASSGAWLPRAVSARVPAPRRSTMLADGLARFVRGRLRGVDDGIAAKLRK